MKKEVKVNEGRSDNNPHMDKLLKENKNRMEIAKEISTNKKIGDIVGERLAKKHHFPPC
ncbi:MULTISPECIES: hypothetical protein [Romboutsia]|uniref:hypothetical protein n=1 Tax=Romboutsia TaxID=1501226 RepID=UPI00159EC13A|nr:MULTISPECIES: hypothetical protein [Romboutsia]MCH1959741.1 hypothetical protein [Romboutsia hominis]MCH1969838.1 hypothetical protein [Romboutsia hominis]MDB8790757.1 hypothetical protein [Romboutsia sp. 1001216sp1]MDB8792495.1 hypothetical protein [Romboutsia sp. 1001216sp1]MDB8795790.1 hypothetical protein [Romboutsia sp. 1001216sp1]